MIKTIATISVFATLLMGFPASVARAHCGDAKDFRAVTTVDGRSVFTDGCSSFPLLPPTAVGAQKVSARNPASAAGLSAANGISSSLAGASAPPSSWSLQQYQGPIKNQGAWGRCFVFAGVAALEAAYRREYGLSLDLSEEYMAHMIGTGGLNGDYYPGPSATKLEERSTFLDFGGAAWDVPKRSQLMRVMETRYAPYMTTDAASSLTRIHLGLSDFRMLGSYDPTTEEIDLLEYDTAHIPEMARMQARYGTQEFSDIFQGTNLTDRLEAAIARNREVVSCLTLNLKYDGSLWQWDDSANGGGHCMAIVAYDRGASYFLAKNSWGTSVPAEMQWMRISYDALRHVYGDGKVIESVYPPAVQLSAQAIGEWVLDFEGRLVIRRFTEPAPQSAGCAHAGCRTKIGVFQDASGLHDVEGAQTADGALSFFIGPANTRMPPGDTSPSGDDHSLTVVDDGSGTPAVVVSGFGKTYRLNSATRHGGPMAAMLVATTLIL